MYQKIIFFTVLFVFNLLHAATLSLESGSVTIDNSETAATCKSFRQTYAIPPVVYVMMDTTGPNNAIIKLTNVSTTQFCAKVMETIFFDGPHNPATVTYIAIPQGVYRLPDGTKVEAGIKTISNVINDDRISDSWTSLTFSHAYSQSPSVITQLQTMNNELPEGAVSSTARGNTNDAISIPWITESVNNITSSSAQIALDKSHIIETGLSITKSEKVGYFIIESNKLGSFTASDNNPVYYQTFLTGNVFGGYYTNGTPCNTISINTLFPTSGYLFVASKAINNSSYGGWMRKCSQTNRNIGLLIDSKQSKGSGKISGNSWTSVRSPDYGLSTRNHPPAPASIVVFSRSFDLSRVVNDANLSVLASVQPSNIIEAGSLIMDVNVSNKGPDNAPNTVLSLSLPNGMTFQQITSGGANWSCAQNSTALDCNLTSGSLSANTTSILSLKFLAPSVANLYTVNVSAASDGLDDDGAGTTAQFQVYNLLVDDDKIECPTASFTTISSALTMAKAGDTVRICKGTYTENVVVNTSDINITSDSGTPLDVIVKGSSSNAFSVNKSNVGINNLSITQNISNSRAVLADNAANLTLDNLVISYTNGSNEAIKLQNSSTTPVLKNLTITSDQSGIKMDGANGFTLTNLNIIAGANSGNYGIYGWNINSASSLSQITVLSGDNAIQVASGQTTTMTDINASSSTARAIYISNGTFSLGVSTWPSNTLNAQLIALQGDSAGAFSVQNTNASSVSDTVMKFSNVGSNTFTFSDNNITGNGANSYGVHIDGGGSASIIQRNIIKNTTTNQGLRLLNNPSFTSKISNNCFMNNLTHNANVSNSGNSQFSGNFWGTTGGITVTPDYTDTDAHSNCPFISTPVLIADYHFDECLWNSTPNKVVDSSGNSLHGTAQGTAQTSTDSVINLAGAFENATSNSAAIVVSDTNILSPHVGIYGEITISAWVKLNSYPSTALQGRIPIVAKGDGNNWEYALYVYQDHKAGFSVWQSSGSSYKEISGGNLALNTWYHITGVLKKGVFERVYVNGALVAESTSGFSGSTTNGTSPLYIARRGSGNNYLNGHVDEAKIFANALTQTQIQSIYNNESADKNYDGSPRNPTNCFLTPIAEYRLEELSWNGTLGEVKDISSNNLHGTTIGTPKPTPVTTTPARIGNPGTCGYGSFPGPISNGGAIEITALPVSTAVGAKTTVSFWMKWNGTNSVMPIGWHTHDLWMVSGHFGFNTGNSDIYGISSTGLANRWVHVVAVFTNNNVTANALYIDGVLQPLTQRLSSPNNTTGKVQSTLRISGWQRNTGYRFSGSIDEIKVFNGELSLSQVVALYNETHSCSAVTPACSSFQYNLYHPTSTTQKLQTRIAQQPFDVNVTVACTGTGQIPARKIQKIYAVNGTCPTVTAGLPLLWSALPGTDINDTSKTISIPNLNSTKAFQNIKLMLETNASELNCSTDSFAIRPPSFGMSAPSSSISAGDFILQISANNSGTGYNGTANLTTGLQTLNPNCITSNGFLKSNSGAIEPLSITFQNDSNISTMTAIDIGSIYINTKDSSWTTIDQPNDCIVNSNTITANSEGLFGCNIDTNLSLIITPHHFDVNATLNNFTGGTFTYLSTDLNMSAQLDLNITAKTSDGNTTKNYTSGCYSKDTTVTLPHSAVPSPLSEIFYRDTINLTNMTITATNPITSTYNASKFNQGSVTPQITLNFDRSPTKPLNPFDFNITSATATDVDITGTTTPMGIAKFVYGRVRAYDIATNISPVDVPVEFEVYSTTSGGYVSGMPQNVLRWYRNLNHDAANEGNVTQGAFSAGGSDTAINTSAEPAEGIQIVTVTSTQDKTVHLDISPWLWYSSKYDYLYSGACTQHPCFNYDYTDVSLGVKGVNSGTFQGSDFQMTPAKNITNKGVKIFR